jgi:hypothetical protein
MSHDVQDDEIPPWGGSGYGRPFRPEHIPPLDPAEFQRVALACIPQQWPKEYPPWWSRPLTDQFSRSLFQVVGWDEKEWTPVHHRFFALYRLLEGSELGPEWPSEPEFVRSQGQIHPAFLHTAAQLRLLPSGDFDPVTFRREARRVARRMGLALPPGLPQDESP